VIYKLWLQISELLLRVLKTPHALIFSFVSIAPLSFPRKNKKNNDKFMVVKQARCIGEMQVPVRHMECSKLRGWDGP
jgi:hypothetical protein